MKNGDVDSFRRFFLTDLSTPNYESPSQCRTQRDGRNNKTSQVYCIILCLFPIFRKKQKEYMVFLPIN